LYEFSNEENTSLYDALDRLVDLKDMKNQQLSKSKQLLQILNNHSQMLEKDDHSDVAGSILEEVGYIEMLQADKTPEADGKLENLKKLVSDIKNRNSIHEFLEEVSLLTDILSNSDGLEKISLMTLHSAKGLEFNYVFLPGWEEGIFPNQRSLDENGNKGLEEERRLGYVGITRARKHLYISYVNFRKQYNYSIYRSIPSRFLSELPDDNCKILKISTKEKVDKKRLSSLVNTKFDIGDKVSHDQFGKGLVLGIYDDQLHIRFENDDKITKIFSDYVKKL
jgi:DNA helicase-2/ATP-dependent DNA helicase PcrA